MPKIYIPTSFGYSERCILGDSESVHKECFTNVLIECFNYNSIEYLLGSEQSFEATVKECDEYKPDLFYSPRTGSSKKHDSRFSSILIYKTQPSALSFRIAEGIRRHREEIYPRSVFINAAANNPEVFMVKSPAIVDYIAFHDQKDEAEFFHDNLRSLACKVAEAICDYYGIVFKTPQFNRETLGFGENSKCDRLVFELQNIIKRYTQGN